MSNLKINGLLWMLIISIPSLFPKITAINSGDVDMKISQVPYMASYGYEGEFYEYLLSFHFFKGYSTYGQGGRVGEPLDLAG